MLSTIKGQLFKISEPKIKKLPAKENPQWVTRIDFNIEMILQD
jgi:hypothetical protein